MRFEKKGGEKGEAGETWRRGLGSGVRARPRNNSATVNSSLRASFSSSVKRAQHFLLPQSLCWSNGPGVYDAWTSVCSTGASQGQGQCSARQAVGLLSLWGTGKGEGADLRHSSGSCMCLLEGGDVKGTAGCRSQLALLG